LTHLGSHYNYCDCSNYCLANNPLAVHIAAINDLILPDLEPGIDSRFRQAGYIVVISPNSSTRCCLDPGCSISYCHSIAVVIHHSSDLVSNIILADILHFKFHFALVLLLRSQHLLKIGVTLPLSTWLYHESNLNVRKSSLLLRKKTRLPI
jgi:hypothetical protein